ncbi:hypothetical protein [Nocardia salmonicida]|uniref:hypothetical protein n=1 Tax=Nocardia salmonicida TaxID=53431 RepID=UPI002E2D5757|nr:hypothetical protein [Nocardia salmonicida]
MEPHDEVRAPEFEESARDPDPTKDNNVLRRVADPGELIAAIPGVLGFSRRGHWLWRRSAPTPRRTVSR